MGEGPSASWRNPKAKSPIVNCERTSAEIIRAVNCHGPLSVEWEDISMDREYGAAEACAFVKKLSFKPSEVAFDGAIEK